MPRGYFILVFLLFHVSDFQSHCNPAFLGRNVLQFTRKIMIKLSHSVPLFVKNKESQSNIKRRNPFDPIPPIALFFLCSSKCSASPLNKHTIVVRGPFFQGWLVRVVDHTKKFSCLFIVGSFSRSKSKKYDEHYVFCGLQTQDKTICNHVFPPTSAVHIIGSSSSSQELLSSIAHQNSPLNITWIADNFGYFKYDGNSCQIKFDFADFKVDMNVDGRLPWSDSNSLAGPEGWLGCTPFLPCHYFIHTTGSNASYKLQIKGDWRTIKGSGYAHMEGNHGTFFPVGWVWSQAIAPRNVASFSLVGGLFTIAGLRPMNWVLYVRSPRRRARIFRTTDGARINYKFDSLLGFVVVEAVSAFGNERVTMSIQSRSTLDSFSEPLYTPSPEGFSNTPGCRETYTADAVIRCYDFDSSEQEFVLIEEINFPLTVLEFGGNFLGKSLDTLPK